MARTSLLLSNSFTWRKNKFKFHSSLPYRHASSLMCRKWYSLTFAKRDISLKSSSMDIIFLLLLLYFYKCSSWFQKLVMSYWFYHWNKCHWNLSFHLHHCHIHDSSFLIFSVKWMQVFPKLSLTISKFITYPGAGMVFYKGQNQFCHP